jgi:hypothetical protein
MSEGDETVIEVNNLWDGVEWSALLHVDKIILAAPGTEFLMSVEHWREGGPSGIGFEYNINGVVRRVAYTADGNVARLIHNNTGIEVPEAIRVVEKRTDQ